MHSFNAHISYFFVGLFFMGLSLFKCDFIFFTISCTNTIPKKPFHFNKVESLMESWFLACLVHNKVVNWWWVCMQMGDSWFHFASSFLQKAWLALCLCIFAIGGSLVGGIAGAIKGQTTETGLCRGAAIGLISGAIVALEIFDSIINGHFLSKVALFGSIISGKAFREWVSPAVLKAYLWQASMLEGSGSDARDIYDVDETRGLSLEALKRLPVVDFHGDDDAVSCSICLQDLVEGDEVRILPKCEHMFHVGCIDEWLVRAASCPVCRNSIREFRVFEDDLFSIQD